MTLLLLVFNGGLIFTILVVLVILYLLNFHLPDDRSGYRWPGNIFVVVIAIILILWLLGMLGCTSTTTKTTTDSSSVVKTDTVKVIDSTVKK